MADFRETLWFKIGFVEAEEAKLVPLEERYLDDGSLTEADIKEYSVRTPPITPPPPRTKP